MNKLDTLILGLSPAWGMRRLQHRLAAQTIGQRTRGYEAASKGRRTKGWKAPGTSANAETERGATITRYRARDLARNNAWAAKALMVITNNVVGTGIRGQFTDPGRQSKRSEKKIELAMGLWQEWAESTACDFDGRHDLYGLQAIVMDTVARDGEALIRKHRVSGLKIPLQLQILEADHLDTSKTTGDGGRAVLQGVEVDELGRAVAYWLFPHHPGDVGFWGRMLGQNKSVRVPADQVDRVYRQERAGQIRGVTWFASIAIPLRDLDALEDARLIQQVIASCFAVFVTNTDPDGTPSTTAESEEERDRVEKLQPGIFEYLSPGESVEFAAPPAPEGFSEFQRAILRKIAAGLGVTYEALTGDLSQTNFSGGRMGWLEFWRNIEAWRWRMLIPQGCDPIGRAFMEAARFGGFDLSGLVMEWSPPHRELINPKEEIAAMISEVRAGFKSLSQVIRERGYDPMTVFKEMAEDNQLLDDYKLILDTDPRRTTQQGQPRDKAPTPAAKPET